MLGATAKDAQQGSRSGARLGSAERGRPQEAPLKLGGFSDLPGQRSGTVALDGWPQTPPTASLLCLQSGQAALSCSQ